MYFTLCRENYITKKSVLVVFLTYSPIYIPLLLCTPRENVQITNRSKKNKKKTQKKSTRFILLLFLARVVPVLNEHQQQQRKTHSHSRGTKYHQLLVFYISDYFFQFSQYSQYFRRIASVSVTLTTHTIAVSFPHGKNTYVCEKIESNNERNQQK